MIHAKDVRNADETLDMIRKVQTDYKALSDRDETTKETKKRATDVRAAAHILERELQGLKDHMEKDEDIV